jgi:predicted RNA-binding protein with PUA-like domain
MNYWLLKTEPDDYSYQDLARAGRDKWDGVRNFQARSHIKAMNPGDMTFIYHTCGKRQIVGLARVVSAPYKDPGDSRFLWIDVEAVKALPRPVSLAEIKAESRFSDWELVRLSRLSVMPVPPHIWAAILEIAGSAGAGKAATTPNT